MHYGNCMLVLLFRYINTLHIPKCVLRRAHTVTSSWHCFQHVLDADLDHDCEVMHLAHHVHCIDLVLECNTWRHRTAWGSNKNAVCDGADTAKVGSAAAQLPLG